MPIGKTYYGKGSQTRKGIVAKSFFPETEAGPKGQAGAEVSFLFAL
jgi:hypothetical protein